MGLFPVGAFIIVGCGCRPGGVGDEKKQNKKDGNEAGDSHAGLSERFRGSLNPPQSVDVLDGGNRRKSFIRHVKMWRATLAARISR